MRPPAKPHSTLRAPLNELLGTEVNVRIFRVLATTSVPMSKAALARRSALNASGVGRSVGELTDWGIVESLGTGSRRLYRLWDQHPLAAPLRGLFAAELARFEAITEGLRDAAHRLKPPPRAVWIQGPVATGTDGPGDSVILGVLASARTIDRTVERLRVGVADLERIHDVTLAVHGLTSADLSALSQEGREELQVTVPLLGPSPLEFLSSGHSDGPTGRSHEDLDQRALRLARAVAAKLTEDPTLIEHARKHIARRLQRASARERSGYEEWDRILQTMSPARLKRFLVENSERATRLRQSLPFVGALSSTEVEALREARS